MNFKKIIALILSIVMCASMSACNVSVSSSTTKSTESSDTTVGNTGDDYTFTPCVKSVDTFESETMPLYFVSPDAKTDINVWFINGYHDVAYLSINDIVDIISAIYGSDEGSENFSLTISNPSEKTVVLTRENNSQLILDYENEELTFTDIDDFTAAPVAANGLDIIRSKYNGSNNNVLISHNSLFYREPDPVVISLAYYGIPMVMKDGVGYLPLQTFADLIMSRIGCYTLYNGECVMLATDVKQSTSEDSGVADTEGASSTVSDDSSSGTENTKTIAEPVVYKTIGDIYYSAAPTTKSDMLKIFNYNELCLALDYCYGMKEEHNITSFNDLFVKADLKKNIMSDSALETWSAIEALVYAYLADLHSMITDRSYMIEKDAEIPDEVSSAIINSETYSLTEMITAMKYYSSLRAASYPDGCPGYEEVDNTAYVTFDQFIKGSSDYYTMEEPTANIYDTLELLMYANKQIKRDNSPIENVVIDLTNNVGGTSDAAACVIAWMLGECTISMEDMTSGAQSTTAYKFDANCNGEFDEGDYLGFEKYNLYCLIGPCSFSCGNLTPAALYASDYVTLIGDDSNGGACTVYNMSTADGNLFTLSGPMRINTMNNGIYYSVDQGVKPNYYIDKLEHLYDREYLTDYINNLP